jgi:spore coat assembly protein
MNIGDIVVRKKYNKDIVFEIIDIKDNIYYLRGIEFRLIADSELDDLELCELNIKEDHFSLRSEPMLKGKILHLDGDEKYLKICEKKYNELSMRVNCYYVKESEMKNKVISLLEKHKPQILVITGHDALRKNTDKKNIHNYSHSLDYVEAIKQARMYDGDKDNLVIVAGACQSFYEMLLVSGANFASSPNRENIHALDPVYIACLIANENVKNYINIEDVVNLTSHKQRGMGGIDTKGVARRIYPIGG